MSLLVTFADMWTTIVSGLDSFLGNPTVQKLGTWLDTGLISAGIIIAYKIVIPKLMENERLRTQKEELEKTVEQIVKLLDTTVENITGIQLNLAERFNGVITVIDTAFKNSNLDAKAKTIISATAQQLIMGNPVDLTNIATQLGDEGNEVMSTVQETITEALSATKNSALEQLELEAQKALNDDLTQEG